MPGTRKIIQLYRNNELIEPSNNNSALENAKLTVENLTPADGEIVLIRYKEDDSDIVKSLVAVYHAEIDNEDSGWTFLTLDDYYNKEEIDETEQVIAAALAQLDGDITTLGEVVENNTQELSDLSDRINAITESDPIFTESPAAAITSSDITNWNGKTSNVGTVTGIIMNGESKGTSGDVDLGTVVTAETDPTVPSWAKASTKPSYTASEVGALPDSTPIPTKTSDLTNDSGFLTQHQDISGKADVVTLVTRNDNGTASLALESGKFYVFSNALTSLTIQSLTQQSSGLGIYAGKFTAGTGGCTFGYPAAVNAAPSVPTTFEDGKTYEFNIMDNELYCQEA